MGWLLWKEYRNNRLIVWITFFLFMIPYAVAGCIYLKLGPIPEDYIQGWLDYAVMASMHSVGLVQLTMALLGGSLIAGERADRSAEFQAYLPISRYKLFMAKILLVLIVAGMIWVTLLLTFEYLMDRMRWMRNCNDISFFLPIIRNTAIVGLTFFCVAWFFSSFLKVPAIAVLIGLTAPPMLFAGIYLGTQFFRIWPPDTTVYLNWWWPRLSYSLSLFCFVAGSWIFLRRREP